MKIRFHPDAVVELNEAIGYYEEIETGLGLDLAIEVHSAMERIVLYPDAWPVIDNDIRRSLVRRFPYGVLYSKESDCIYILAIMHLHREPEYWKNRS